MHPAALVAFAFMALGAVVCVFRPAWVAPYFAAVIYAHIPDALRTEYGLPSFFMFLAPGLVALALARRVLFGGEVGAGWKNALWWLVAWGAVIGASYLYAADRTRTTETLLDYLDAVFIVWIATLFLSRREQLAPVAWALVGAGTFLAVLTVHQKLTGNWGSTYGGFANAELRSLLGDLHGMRSAGPVSTNYFALILVALVPLAAERMLHARARAARAAAAAGLAAILAAIAFTYSRGGFVALAAVAGLVLLSHPRWPRIALAAAPLAIVGLLLLPETYTARIASFAQVWDGMRGRHVEDSAIRGRLSEVRSAAMMFGAHPLVGVGSGNYEYHYTQYARAVGLDGRREERQAHSLYLEIAAENGLLGLSVFGGLLAFTISGVRRTRASFLAAGDTESAHLAYAIGMALAGYLVGAVFLHLSYPRFFWLLVGIAMAVRGLSAPEPATRPSPFARTVWVMKTLGGATRSDPCA